MSIFIALSISYFLNHTYREIYALSKVIVLKSDPVHALDGQTQKAPEKVTDTGH